MQAILTKYVPPTNTKPARVKAWCASGKIIVSYQFSDEFEEHRKAAQALIDKLWPQGLYRLGAHGGTPDGHVFLLGLR